MRPMIALMRAREDADRSAAKLEARGFRAVVAPATETRATGAHVPGGERDAVVATSAKALTLLGGQGRSAIVGLPLFVVGSGAARVAAEAGLILADAAAVDVADMIARLRERLPALARILYLAGQDRRSDLEAALAASGHRLTVAEIYAAEARAAWSPEEAEAVAACGAILHYSHRSAELAWALAEQSGIVDRFRARLHVCLSRDAAEPLRVRSTPRLFWPRDPNEDALFDTLESVAAEFGVDRG